MTGTPIENAVATLESVLTRERDLLMTGRARETAELVGEKVSALQVFDDLVVNRSSGTLKDGLRRRVETVIGLAKENEQHFTAVRNGLRSAISRIETMTDGAYVGAYNVAGGQTPFRNATGGYVKKV